MYLDDGLGIETRGIKNIGGTNKLLTPCQSTVNASIPVE
jgi:hypothetical protein